MREVEYEQVTAAPVDEIVELYKAGEWWQESPEARAVIPCMIKGSLCFMVARALDGRIVGMARVISDGFSDAYIQDVVVLKSHRGLGVGRELIKRLTQFCVSAQNILDWPDCRTGDTGTLRRSGIRASGWLPADALWQALMSEISFLGFKFSDLKLEDYGFLSGFLKRYPQPLAGYTFSTLAAWQPFFHYRWVLAEPETLLISCMLDPDPHPHLLQPVGPVSPALADKLIQAASGFGIPSQDHRSLPPLPGRQPIFSQSFAGHEDRAVSNYLYSAAALAKLSGRKYSKKRNLLAQASALYKWTVHTLTKANADLFSGAGFHLWEERPQMEGMLAREVAALECTLHHLDAFAQQGGDNFSRPSGCVFHI